MNRYLLVARDGLVFRQQGIETVASFTELITLLSIHYSGKEHVRHLLHDLEEGTFNNRFNGKVEVSRVPPNMSGAYEETIYIFDTLNAIRVKGKNDNKPKFFYNHAEFSLREHTHLLRTYIEQGTVPEVHDFLRRQQYSRFMPIIRILQSVMDRTHPAYLKPIHLTENDFNDIILGTHLETNRGVEVKDNKQHSLIVAYRGFDRDFQHELVVVNKLNFQANGNRYRTLEFYLTTSEMAGQSKHLVIDFRNYDATKPYPAKTKYVKRRPKGTQEALNNLKFGLNDYVVELELFIKYFDRLELGD